MFESEKFTPNFCQTNLQKLSFFGVFKKLFNVSLSPSSRMKQNADVSETRIGFKFEKKRNVKHLKKKLKFTTAKHTNTFRIFKFSIFVMIILIMLRYNNNNTINCNHIFFSALPIFVLFLFRLEL
ncbi:hypothetical protein SSS_04398 [Sarcoptes scabiei]|nr:hypothetical protein SSS_04398 [Sarcoptes scabiei]